VGGGKIRGLRTTIWWEEKGGKLLERQEEGTLKLYDGAGKKPWNPSASLEDDDPEVGEGFQ